MSNLQIAAQLFISRSTVKMHFSNVYIKLRIANRTELARAIATRAADPRPQRETMHVCHGTLRSANA